MAWLAGIFGYVLNWLYNIVQNYGVAIILFSILLKLLLLPLTIRQQRSLEKNAKIQEEIQKLQFKYKNDQEKLNAETMELYRREKVSPMSGCLEMILQLFIFISVFYLVSRPLTYMKKIDTAKIEEYKNKIEAIESGEAESQELSTEIEEKEENSSENIENSENTENDSENVEDTEKTENIENTEDSENNTEKENEEVNAEQTNNSNKQTKSNYIEIKIIELYGDSDEDVRINMNFLGIDLTKVPMQNLTTVTVFILPLLYIISTFANMKYTSYLQNKDKKKKEAKKAAEKAERYEKLQKEIDKIEDAEEKEKKQKELEETKKYEDAKNEFDESTEGMTKSMNYMMPIMSVAIAMIAPSGLSLYWLTSNVLNLAERFTINLFNKKEKEEA